MKLDCTSSQALLNSIERCRHELVKVRPQPTWMSSAGDSLRLLRAALGAHMSDERVQILYDRLHLIEKQAENESDLGLNCAHYVLRQFFASFSPKK